MHQREARLVYLYRLSIYKEGASWELRIVNAEDCRTGCTMTTVWNSLWNPLWLPYTL